MNEICSLKNTSIDKISLLFCSHCKALVDINAKRCDNLKCSKIFCSECIKDSKCSNCKKGHLKKISIKSIDLENVLFCCKKSKECKEKYTYEEKIKNHSHKKISIINCINCKENLTQTMNCLKCTKCNNFFCYKRLSYNPLINNEENTKKNCGMKCFKCNKHFCSLCEKNNKNKLICSECLLKNSNEDIIINEKNKCNSCLKDKSWKVCSVCNNNICFSCSNVCENYLCQKIVCINCSLFCNICKKIICQKCSIRCSSCPPNKSLVSCINCDSDAIFKCSMKNCDNKVCLNCLKYCNYCNEINCTAHSLSCANCSESICPFHWHMCKKCSTIEEDFSKNKLCLKNCTKKCHFCNNEINIFCKEKNHPDNFVKQYPCGHYLCNSCVKKCDICKETVRACSYCEKENNYIQCRICNKYLCNYCSKKCTLCGQHYCDESHNCFFCNMTIYNEVCLNCEFNERTHCMICSKKLYQCAKCYKIIVCSNKCFLNHIKIKSRINKTFSRSRTSQSIKSNITNNVINNVVNLFQNGENESTNMNSHIKGNKAIIETKKGDHICLMYYCEEHIRNNQKEPIMIECKNIEDLKEESYNINKYKRIANKDNVKCSPCIIF